MNLTEVESTVEGDIDLLRHPRARPTSVRNGFQQINVQLQAEGRRPRRSCATSSSSRGLVPPSSTSSPTASRSPSTSTPPDGRSLDFPPPVRPAGRVPPRPAGVRISQELAMPFTPRPPHYDVIVVGARAAGAATAMLLARAGLDVLVVDRMQLRPGHDVHPLADARRRPPAASLGTARRLIAAGTPPVRKTTFHVADDTISIGYEVAARRRRAVRASPHRARPDPRRRGGVRGCHRALRLHGERSDPAGDGRVRGIVGHDDRGVPFEATANIVVGADGMGSNVARWVDAPIERIGVQRERIRLRLLERHRDGGLRALLPSGSVRRCGSDEQRRDGHLRRNPTRTASAASS